MSHDATETHSHWQLIPVSTTKDCATTARNGLKGCTLSAGLSGVRLSRPPSEQIRDEAQG